MGSRGAYLDVKSHNFNFKENGQEYFSLGILSSNKNVKILMKKKGSVAPPLYSHTPGRIYAVVQSGILKYLVYYDETHKQTVCIDFGHYHNGIKPHVHFGVIDHGPDKPGIPPTQEQLNLANRIRKEFNLK